MALLKSFPTCLMASSSTYIKYHLRCLPKLKHVIICLEKVQMVPSYINDMCAIGYQISTYLRKPSFPIRLEISPLTGATDGWVFVFFEFSWRASGHRPPTVPGQTQFHPFIIFIHGTILYIYGSMDGWVFVMVKWMYMVNVPGKDSFFHMDGMGTVDGAGSSGL